MNVIVGEWLQLTMEERLRVLEYVVWQQKKARRQSGPIKNNLFNTVYHN